MFTDNEMTLTKKTSVAHEVPPVDYIWCALSAKSFFGSVAERSLG